MVYDSSFLLAVKDRVTEKLKTLGAFIDDELPDYIMVMVANQKNESSMAKDLQLFLGEHTKKFTEWLHNMLENMKSSGRDSSDSRKESETTRSTRQKSGRRKATRPHSPDSQDDSPSKSLNRSRSRSPLERVKRRKYSSSSREPHGDSDVVSTKVSDDLRKSEDNGGYHVKEERKVMSTSSLSRKPNHENEKVASHLSDETSLKSVVEVKNSDSHKQTKKRLEYPQPSSLLLKRAVNEAKESTLTSESIPAKRKPISRPVACSDVSSSSQPDSTRFFITLSGTESNPVETTTSSHRRNNISKLSRLQSVECSSGGGGGDIDALDNRKMRLLSRIVNSSSIRRDGRLSAKQRLGPVIQQPKRTRITSISRNEEKIIYNSGNDIDDYLDGGDYVELACDDIDDNAFVDDIVDERNFLSRNKMTIGERLSLKKPPLVVSLNETDEEEDIANHHHHHVADKGLHKKIVLQKSEENTQNATDPNTEAGDQQNIPSSLERCKFWPNCRNGTSCQYIHPSEPCQLFPRCKFGTTCTFIHPPCRYGAACARADCPFTHSAKRVLPVVSANPAQIVCRFQGRCTNPLCQFYHPPVVVQPSPLVIRQPVAPMFAGPIPCRFGSACTNRAKCPFLHSDLPSVDQLKWIAPSKKQQQISNSVSADDNSPNKVNKPMMTTTTVKAA
uniref:Zinc finger CCCH domain-containing protein 14 n=1 Tax=Trichobilharzia regenti TaxID=157069 RepID=A0AA85K8P2_TRIRE|nr:unnamed protein product [Trichobilharzia regenti]